MIETHYSSAEQLMASQRTRRALLMGLLITTVVMVFGTVAALAYFTQVHAGIAVLLGLALFLTFALPVAIWNQPRVGLYVLFAGVLLFGGDPAYPNPHVPTTYVPFVWNLSIAGQTYLSSRVLEPLIFSVAELLLLYTLVVWLIRAIATRTLKLETGEHLPFILLYSLIMGLGLVHGLWLGGDLRVALWEVRGQYHFLATYLLAVNLLKDRENVRTLLWVAVASIGLQGTLGAFDFASQGFHSPPGGILPHEESLFFAVVFFIMIVSVVTNPDKKLTAAALLFTPMAALATLANQRRAGIGAFLVAFVALLPILWVVVKHRRRHIGIFCALFAAATAVYLPVAWKSNAAWALPARALRSQSDPNARDAQSNAYRDLENRDTALTRDQHPWIGVGYGIPFDRTYSLPEINFPLADYIPHNGLMWIWFRVGHLGFWAFWMIIALLIVKGIHTLKVLQDPILQLMGFVGVTLAIMLYIFGKYDMIFNNPRVMIAVGVFFGAAGALRAIHERQAASAPALQVEAVPGSDGPPAGDPERRALRA